MRDLAELTAELGRAYDSWKGGEEDKNELRKEFFQLATDRHKTSSLAQRVEIVEVETREEAYQAIERTFPTWTIKSIDPVMGTPPTEVQSKRWAALIEENPQFKEFSYVNPNDGRVYSRQVVIGSPLLDDERIQAEEPELWEAISQPSREEFNLRQALWLSLSDDGYDEHADNIVKAMGYQRELLPLEDLTPEQLGAIQDYIYYGKPTVKFPAPRPAKPEELPEPDGSTVHIHNH